MLSFVYRDSARLFIRYLGTTRALRGASVEQLRRERDTSISTHRGRISAGRYESGRRRRRRRRRRECGGRMRRTQFAGANGTGI